MMSLKDMMDRIYGELAPRDIPWNLEEPPGLLIELVDSGGITPCDVVDLGCGAGNYAVWLAARGFRVTGIDVSPKALELAARLAADSQVDCRFLVADLCAEVGDLHGTFDFAFDWELLHHVFPEQRERYAANVHRLLRAGGRYLSVSFSEEDPAFGGSGKYRTTPLGTTLYFSTEQELRDLFEPWFRIRELRTVEIPGKRQPHTAVMVLMTRRDPGASERSSS
jgi:SAM-dependent methyltransferase